MHITWGLTVRRANNTFPTSAIFKAHDILGHYFNATFAQTSRPSLYYYLSDQYTGSYAFTRFSGLRGIHFPSNNNYNLDVEIVAMSLIHEIGHWITQSGWHGSNPLSIMAAAPHVRKNWFTQEDYNRVFYRMGVRAGRNPFVASDHNLWFPKPQGLLTAGPHNESETETLDFGLCSHHKVTLWERFLGYLPKKVVTLK